MNKFKLFVGNFFVYGLGGIISKIIPLIMVPIVTRLMPDTAYFGIYDLSGTLIGFASAFALMGIYDALYRMFFENEEENYKITVCSTALTFVLGTSAVVLLILLIAKEPIAQFFLSDKHYAYVVSLSAVATLISATSSIIVAPTRMQNHRKVFLITNAISPFISYGITVPLILAGHYVIALPLSFAISDMIMEVVFGILNRKWFSLKRFDPKILKQLLLIGIPLLPNFLIYWLFDSSDKLMITNLIGIGAAGIYSVSAKLGHCSQLIYTAFAGGWQFFAFSTMKEDDQVKSNSLVFEYLGIISFAATLFICAWSYDLFKILFTENYLDGYIVAPYLFFAPLLQMLFQVAANQFLVIKKTWPNMFILSAGAAANIVLNLLLIPVLGIEGAAIATLLGYFISDIICVLVLCKMQLMVISGRFLLASAVMMFCLLTWRLFVTSNTLIGTVIAIAASVFFIFLYRKDLKQLLVRK